MNRTTRPNRLKIREIKEHDLGKLSEIYAEVYRVFDIGERWTAQKARVLLRYWLKKQPDLALLAEIDREIVGGFVVGVKPWWDGNHLVDGEIFVHPDYQRKGIGAKLLEAMLERADKKYDAVRFDTFTFRDSPALKWYKSIGFREITEWAIIGGDVKTVLGHLRK